VDDYGNEVLFDAKIARLAPASGQCGENVMWHFDGSGVLTISGTGEMYYTEYPEYYDFCEEIEKIIIEQGVTSISDYAFSSMEYLTQVSIPASVTHIGTAAFNECSSLETVIYYGTVASREQLELENNDNGNLLDAEWFFLVDPYTISEIRLLDLTMTEIEDVPEGDFNVAVTVTNNSFEYVALYMICAYDEKGTLICSDFLYASPEVGGSVVFGTQISNSDGKAVKIKAFVFDAQNPLSPIAEAAEWSIE